MKFASMLLGTAVALASVSSSAHDTSPPNPYPPAPTCYAWGGAAWCFQNRPSAAQPKDSSVNLIVRGSAYTGCRLYVFDASGQEVYHLALGPRAGTNEQAGCDGSHDGSEGQMSSEIMKPGSLRLFECQGNGVATGVDAEYRADLNDCLQ
jgi:hypothetical protein